MSRYIDADRLDECMKIVQRANKDSVDFNKRCRATDVFLDIWDMIKEQPTVDVVEVVHAEWIDKGEEYMIRWTCSNCGRRDTHIYDFCPDCGADMRGGTDESVER